MDTNEQIARWQAQARDWQAQRKQEVIEAGIPWNQYDLGIMQACGIRPMDGEVLR